MGMPRKKPAIELTTEQALKRLFSKKAREELYRLAHEKDSKQLKIKDLSRSQD